jgi:4'-phosphopantetheinyl transferase EntD
MQDYSSIFDDALPADVVLEYGDPRDSAPVPFPEESSIVANAVEKRQLEFAKGRQCARAALRRLGVADRPLLIGSHREPLWPPGVTGSITHTAGLCAAAVSWEARYGGVGIDVEQAEALQPEIAERVASVREMEALASMPPLLVARLVFSAKESFYKCQFYQTRRWLDFFDVTIALQRSGAFEARLLVDAEPLAHGSCFQGTWRQRHGFFFTAIGMPGSKDSSGRSQGR